MSEQTMQSSGRFLMTFERALQEANREAIHSKLPPLTVENVIPLMATVAKLRARYLQLAFELCEKNGKNLPHQEEIATLKDARLAYEEILHAAQELEHCVNRGYVDIASSGAG